MPRLQKIKRSDIPMQEIVDACEAFHEHRGPTPDVALSAKYPVKVILSRMDQMSEMGILECGVSLRTSWVKDRSKIKSS